MLTLPKRVQIKGKDFDIVGGGDWRAVAEIVIALSSSDLEGSDLTVGWLTRFYPALETPEDFVINQDCIEHLVQFMEAFVCRFEPTKEAEGVPIMSWEKDITMIVDAVNKHRPEDIRGVGYMHWWTFLGYFHEIDPETSFGTVVSIRNKRKHGRKLEKHEAEYYRENRDRIDIRKG